MGKNMMDNQIMNVNVAGYTLKELEVFFLKKKYSEQTKLILIDLFCNREQPATVARKFNMTPQRINNIKSKFLAEYKSEVSYIMFEGQINTDNLEELKEFAKKCKYLKIITSNEPSRKIYL